MPEELHLVTELAIILIAAGVFTVISKALKQPLILGYIVAGFIVGPSLGLFPQFSPESVKEWSELGIIFLLFSLGLEFSFKKLLKVGSAALITAGINCIGMFAVGFSAGAALGWANMECVFLGGLMSMSSTTIIIKAYDEMGIKNKPYAGLVFGTLVAEDLIAVLLMVLLSTMAVSNKFAGGEMILGLGKLVFFMVLWFLVGIFVIPTILKKAKKYLSDEILLLVSIGLCFLMVVLANLVGFSSALGAFVMGSILSSTMEGERIEKLTGSIKDLFGAIFFVSVGMMVDPAVIGKYWATILLISVVAVVGKCLFSIFSVVIAGKGLDTAVHVGLSLAQLGEFSFIIAGLGCSLGVMRDFIYPIIIAVSVITTFTTPYMIKAGDPVAAWLMRVLPSGLLSRINPPQDAAGPVNAAETNEWKQFIKTYTIRVGLYAVILIAILMGSDAFLCKTIQAIAPNWGETAVNIAATVITLVVMFPFLYGLAVNGTSLKESAGRLMHKNDSNKWPILSLILLRIMLAVLFILLAIISRFDLAGWTIFVIIFFGFLLFVLARGSVHRFTKLEDRFLSNLNEKEAWERSKAPVTAKVKESLSGYDVHLSSVEVSPDFAYAGKKLREMPFRHSSGVNIVKIMRGSRQIIIPSGDEIIYPADKLLAVGTQEQLSAFEQIMDSNTMPAEPIADDFVVKSIVLGPDSNLTSQTLRESGLRHAGCLLISVLHDGKSITNPGPEYVFEESDVVWLAGPESAVEWYA